MFALVVALLLVVNEATASSVNGEGCSSVNTTSRPVINMCGDGRWRLGVAYVSVTPTNMGNSTRCGCTLFGHVQGQDITTKFLLKHIDPNIQGCAETVLTVRRPGKSQDFTCALKITSVTLNSTDNINMTLSRSIGVVFPHTSLCLSIMPVSHAENNILLTCGSGAQTSTASPMSPDPTTTPSTSTSTTSSAPSTTSEVPTSVPSTFAPSSAMVASTVEMTSSTNEMTSNTEPLEAGERDREPEDNQTDLIPPIVGGVVGGSALLIIIIVLIVVCTRKKRQNYPPREERHGVRSVGSEDVLIDNVLYESSSAHASSQPAQASQPGPTNEKGVNQNVNDNLGGPSVVDNKTSADEAMFSMGNAIAATSPAAATAAAPPAAAVSATAAARRPTSDVYAVVNKPGRRQKPTDSLSTAATSQSAIVILPSSKMSALVNKSRILR